MSSVYQSGPISWYSDDYYLRKSEPQARFSYPLCPIPCLEVYYIVLATILTVNLHSETDIANIKKTTCLYFPDHIFIPVLG